MLNKSLLLAGAAALALAFTAPVLADPPAGKKVDVCHVPPGNPANAHVINVGVKAAAKGHNVGGEPRGGADHTDPANGGDPELGVCVEPE